MLAPIRCKLDGQFVDLGVVADRGADQADLGVTGGDGALRRRPADGPAAARGRAVDIAGQTETTAAPAAACDLHQVHVAEFGVGRVERARRVDRRAGRAPRAARPAESADARGWKAAGWAHTSRASDPACSAVPRGHR